jgi:hypothetical protein
MRIDEILAGKRDDILRIAAKHGVTSIRVFGSVGNIAGSAGEFARSPRRNVQSPEGAPAA